MNEREVITENLKKLPLGKSVNLLHFVAMLKIISPKWHTLAKEE